MANESQVIREFLVSLGFTVNETGQKKFTGALEKTSKLAMQTGKAVLTVGTAAQVMVALFTSNMEKMYYASQRTGATVGNLQAAEFGFKNVGLEAGTATASLEAMAAAVRMNPGLRGLMNNILGKDTSKMDQMEAMVELVQKLSTLPHNVGAGIIGNLGVDEKTFFMLKKNMPEMLAAIAKRKQMQADAGIDPDAAAKASKEYQNILRGLLEKVDLLQSKLSIALLEPAREFAKVVGATLDRIIAFNPKPVAEEAKDVKEWITGDLSDPNKAAPKNALRPGGRFGGSMSDLWKFLKGERGLTTDAGAGRGGIIPPTVTDGAPVDLNHMTKEQNEKFMKAAAAQFALRPPPVPFTPGQTPADWKKRNGDYAAGQPDRDAERLRILNQELSGATNPTDRARLQREIARSGGDGAKVEINQTNNIKFEGGDAMNSGSIEQRTDAVLKRAAADLVRNFQGATR